MKQRDPKSWRVLDVSLYGDALGWGRDWLGSRPPQRGVYTIAGSNRVRTIWLRNWL